MLKENNCQPKILFKNIYIFFRIECEIKTFPDEKKQVCHQKIYIERNIKGSCLGRRTIQMEKISEMKKELKR